MKINYKQLLATVAVMALLLLAQTYLISADPLVEQGTTNFTAVSAEDLTATDDLVVGDDAAVTGDATLGTLDVTGAGTIGDDLTVGGAILPSFLNLTVTTGSTLTPIYTVYALDSGGAVTMTLAAAGTEGQLLILIGDDDNTITINDTNVRTSDGNSKDIGIYDVMMLIYQDSEWLEMLLITNS